MLSMDNFFFRTPFKLKAHEPHSAAFQQLISDLFRYGVEGFYVVVN